MNQTSLEQLQEFLADLFQFEAEDLNFGVYKILNYKREEIENFIDELLVEKVQKELQTLTEAETTEIEEQISELEDDDLVAGWLNADDEKRETIESIDTQNKIEKYKGLKKKLQSATVSEETENQIYNHLTLFFSRYYESGDFISQRRFGKNEKYVVPHNGEEILYYWANREQYYIKSSENFKRYAFEIDTNKGSMEVSFKLADVKTSEGNKKSDESHYFILSEKEPEIGEKNAVFYFEYRPLTSKEDDRVGRTNKQDTLSEEAYQKIKEKFEGNTLLAQLWEKNDKRPHLQKKLYHFTRKNKYDFFIHKHLKDFLQKELDYYIKSELVEVDDLYISDTDEHFDRLKLRLKTIKVFKSIADTIINFVSQIEEFQKKLWEKKKFVLATEWVITIDKLIGFIGEEPSRPFLDIVLKSEEQLQEWKDYFGSKIFDDWNNIKVENLHFKRDKDQKTGKQKRWRKLPVDTKYFDTTFKEQLLNVLSEHVDIEAAIDGLVTESDNYQGLNLLKYKFHEKVNTVYIDPPYNSGGNDFLYKDNFRNSSWLTMIENRIPLAKYFMARDGLFFSSIDDKDAKNKVAHRLSGVLEAQFGKRNYIENVIWIKNTTHNDASTFSHNHEYIQAYTKDKDSATQEQEMFRKAKPGYDEVKELVHKLNKEYPTPDEISQKLRQLYKDQRERYKEEALAMGLDWNKQTKRNNPWKGIKQYKFAEYRLPDGTYVEPENAEEKEAVIWVYREDNPSWPNANTLTKDHRDPESDNYRFYKPIHPDTGKECNVPKTGWRWKKEKTSENSTSFNELLEKKKIHFGDDENKIPQVKRFLDTVSTDVTKSTLTDFTDGEKELTNLIGERGTFPNPKPTTVIKKILSLSSKKDGYVLDFFAGSGTTAHSTMVLNDGDERNLKFLLQDMARNVHQTIIPRIKKVAYTFDWDDGEPKDQSMNGLGVFFKYNRLEQYEESLENIAFDISEEVTQQALEFDDYMPKYFLEFETRGSKTLVNTEEMKNPWEYDLKYWNGFTFDQTKPVDLVETFNYLIGLQMHKCITEEENGVKYRIIYGLTNKQNRALIIWRDVSEWEKEDYKKDKKVIEKQVKQYEFDKLYINDQAHIDDYEQIEEIFENQMVS